MDVDRRVGYPCLTAARLAGRRGGLTVDIRRAVATMVVTAVVSVVALPAAATPPGLDVSWPQCPAVSLGPAGGFSIVGLTNGRAYTDNPCLVTEWRWASSTGAPTGLYLVLNS